MRRIFTLLLTILLIFTMANTAFASLVSGSEPSATIPINANFSAQAIMFDVSETVAVTTATDNPTVLVFSEPKFFIENTMTMGYLVISKMVAEGINGWTVVPDITYSDWKTVAFNSNQISILAESTDKLNKTDLSGQGFTDSIDLKYGTKIEFDLSGHTGAVTQDVSGETVAKIITTISLKTNS